MYLTVKQAAEQLQVCEKTIRRRIKDGSLRSKRIGEKPLRVTEEDLKAFAEGERKDNQ